MKVHIRAVIFYGFLIISVWSIGKLYGKITGNSLIMSAQAKALDNRTPTCLDRGNISNEELHWLYIPNNSTELATHEYYGYLSGQLIQTGAVDASECPLNGLWLNGYANACGLEKTREESLYLQNVYDDEILAVGRDIGVPPVMIKQLIRYESQFWPKQRGGYHFGLGQLTYPGAIAALSWNRELNNDIHAHSLPSDDLPSVLLSMMDASCETCTLGIDIAAAEQSITYLGETLLGYCRQTSQIVYNATEDRSGDVVDYATIWKLTLFNYNMGPMCVYESISEDYDIEDEDKLTWDEIVNNIKDNRRCAAGIDYVENITAEYYDLRLNR